MLDSSVVEELVSLPRLFICIKHTNGTLTLKEPTHIEGVMLSPCFPPVTVFSLLSFDLLLQKLSVQHTKNNKRYMPKKRITSLSNIIHVIIVMSFKHINVFFLCVCFFYIDWLLSIIFPIDKF